MRKLCLFLALPLIATAASAQTMNAEAFHKRAAALKAKGAMAIFSSGEIKALMAEGKASGEAARNERLAAQKTGRAQRYCPPAGRASMDSDEFMRRLSAIAQAERQRIDMTEATTRILAAKYPCAK
nr:hypothetical protein [uncultured Sphingomonas sp.]